MTEQWSGNPATWVIDQLVSEADLNTELRDRMEFVYARFGAWLFFNDDETSIQNTNQAWATLPLDDVLSSLNYPFSIASNRIQLDPGDYLFDISVYQHYASMGASRGRMWLRLQEISPGSDALEFDRLSGDTESQIKTQRIIGVISKTNTSNWELQARDNFSGNNYTNDVIRITGLVRKVVP